LCKKKKRLQVRKKLRARRGGKRPVNSLTCQSRPKKEAKDADWERVGETVPLTQPKHTVGKSENRTCKTGGTCGRERVGR